MEIIVRKPTKEEIEQMKKEPIWKKEPEEFDWEYDATEICLIIEGSAIIEYELKEITIQEGDLVIFPKGLKCLWKVKNSFKKHYKFN
jgi:uncharacterized cupin superfamily protein